MKLAVYDSHSATLDGPTVLVALDGTVEAPGGAVRVQIESPGETLKYPKVALDCLKLELARLCCAGGLKPLEDIEGQVRGLNMPVLRHEVSEILKFLQHPKGQSPRRL